MAGASLLGPFIPNFVGGQFDAFRYDGTMMIDLGNGPCASEPVAGSTTNATAYGINNSGQITGISINVGCIRAFLYNGTTMIAIPTLGGDFNDAFAINSKGEVTGRSLTVRNKAYHAFLYNGTTTIDLGALTPSRTDGSIGLAVNDNSEVVGQSALVSADHAFLYNGLSMLDVNNLIDPTDPLYGNVVFNSATGINNSGQIVANGCYTSGPFEGQCGPRLPP